MVFIIRLAFQQWIRFCNNTFMSVHDHEGQ